MPRKKLPLISRRTRRKPTFNKKIKAPNVATNTTISQKKYKDLQLKFKLKELRIILHDIAKDKKILPHQKHFANQNIDPLKVIVECKQSTNKIFSKKEKPPVYDILNTEHSNVKSSTIVKENHDIDKIEIDQQNIENDFDIQNKVLNVKNQEARFHEHIELSSISDSIDKKKEEACKAENDIRRTVTSDNADQPIVARNSNQNLYLHLLNEIVPVANIHTEERAEKQNINFNEEKEETCIIDDNLKILLNQEDRNKVHTQNAFKKKHLPKITEDKLLAKNTVLLKVQDNIETTNNLQDTDYCTNAVIQNKSNSCLSSEKQSRVVDLTEDNIYKFLENYNPYLLTEENTISSNTSEYVQSPVNSNNSEISLKTNKKRDWIPQKTQGELEKTVNKRIKLNRRRIQDKSCTITNNSVYPPDNNNSNFFSTCPSVNINNDRIEDVDDRLTLYSNKGNSLCTILLVPKPIKTDFNSILGSTHDVEENNSINTRTTVNVESQKTELLLTEKYHQNSQNIVKNYMNDDKLLSCSTQLNTQNQVEHKINDNHDSDYSNDGSDDNNGNNNSCGTNNDNKNDDNDDNDDNGNNNNDDNNCSNKDDGDDEDCISLFTDSLLSVDLMDVPSNESGRKNTVHDYKMTGNTFNKYLEQNILEFNKEFNTIEENNTLNGKSCQQFFQEKYENIERNNINSISSHVINNNSSSYPNKNHNKHKKYTAYDEEATITCTKQMEPIECQTLCKGFCFAKMKSGDCNRTSCYFNHELQTLITCIIIKYKQYLTSIIHYAYCMKYDYLLRRLYRQSLQECNIACIMDLYKKLYSIQYMYSDMVRITVEALMSKGMHSKDVVDNMCKILISTDMWTPLYILTSIKDKIEDGEYWNTLRSLLTYVKPSKEVVESILNDCIITHQHIQDVHINLIQKLHPIEVSELNKDLMVSFNNLLNHKRQKIPHETSPKSVNENEGSSEGSYVLQSISDLPETHSLYRDRFWKIYLMIYNIKEALVHEDYDYVISILNKYEVINEDESLFSRCCFHMLTAEIKHSEYHISKIIEHAVQTGASSILYKVLLDIATYILMKLIIENAWTLAYKLLKTLQIYKLQHSAAFIILSAEIYLANQHAIKAFMLIKHSNIISTNRDKWNVESNAQDYDPRTNIVGILLDVLCIKSPEHAFFIFQFLAKDQGNNFHPIDLTHYVDKLMLKLLIVKEIELIVKMGYMIIEYNFAFYNMTICRAAIASIVHIDMILAKQLYQYAIGLGIYRTIELLPVIHVLINVDWVEEEIYLTFWDLFKRLAMDVGHSIDHLNAAHLTVYIIFEMVPTEAHLYYENPDGQQKKKIQMSKNMVRQVLSSRFEPPILISKKKTNGKIIKLQNRDVINYLKAIYNTYIE